jgi:hypothetical protein
MTNITSGFGAITAYSVGAPNGPIGKVFHVARNTSNAWAYINDLYPAYDDDGVQRVYGCDGTADDVQLQAAIDAAKGGTNAYIFVYPGAYNLTALVTLSGKSSVHLIAVNGGNVGIGASGAALLQQGGNFACLALESYAEVSGFQFINKAGYPAITMATSKWRPNVHHNYFHVVGGTACNIIEATGTGFSHGSISHNRFQCWVGGNFTSYINISGSNSVLVEKNVIIQYNGTTDYGILMGSGVQNIALDNIITDCGGAGVITVGIDLGGATGNTAIGNRIATLSGRGVAGGTADRSFVDNRDSTSGGATPIET